MDSQTGEIYSQKDAAKLETDKRKKLTSFGKGEVVCIKGCYFKIIYIRTDKSSITLQGIPVPLKEE